MMAQVQGMINDNKFSISRLINRHRDQRNRRLSDEESRISTSGKYDNDFFMEIFDTTKFITGTGTNNAVLFSNTDVDNQDRRNFFTKVGTNTPSDRPSEFVRKKLNDFSHFGASYGLNSPNADFYVKYSVNNGSPERNYIVIYLNSGQKSCDWFTNVFKTDGFFTALQHYFVPQVRFLGNFIGACNTHTPWYEAITEKPEFANQYKQVSPTGTNIWVKRTDNSGYQDWMDKIV